MKKFIPLLVVLMVFGTAAFASNEPESETGVAVTSHGSTVKVLYKGKSVNDVTVVIRDSKGRLIFTETIRKTAGFSRPYNLQNWPEGEYAVELTDASGSVVERISTGSESLQNNARLIRLEGEGNRYLLTVPNKGNNQLTIRIYTANNKVVYNRVEKIQGDFAQLFRLEDDQHPYYVEVTPQNSVSKTLTF